MVNQISVFVENKLGRLAQVLEIIANAGVNLSAISIGDTADFGILRLIADKTEIAEKALKDANLSINITKVLGLKISDAPGSFAKVVQILSESEISIEYMYSFNTGFDNKSSIIIRVNNNEKAIKVLQKNNIELI